MNKAITGAEIPMILIAIKESLCTAVGLRQDFQSMTNEELERESYSMEDEIDAILSASIYILEGTIDCILKEIAVYQKEGEVLQ